MLSDPSKGLNGSTHERVCPSCGRHVPADSAFCDAGGCGTYLGWATAPGAAAAAAPAPGSTQAAPAPVAETVDLGAQPAASPYSLRLSEQRVSVAPGESGALEVLVRNNASIVEQFDLAVGGPLGAVAALDPPVLRVFPGQEGSARLTLSPPVGPFLPAGNLPFSVQARSRQGQDVQEVGAVLCLGRCGEIVAELLPQKTRGRWWAFATSVGVRNDTNTPRRIDVAVDDPERRLRWKTPVLSGELMPGASGVQRLAARSRIKWSGPEESLPFVVRVSSIAAGDDPGDAAVTTLDGLRVQRALLPRWLLPVVLLLVAAVVALLMLAGGAEAVRVPSVVGSSQSEAVAALEDVGLVARVEDRVSVDVPDGEVIGTDPQASTSMEPGESVTVFVSSGPPAAEETTVPNLVGKHVDEVEGLLAEDDLELGEVMRVTDPDTDPGFVVRTTPEAGATAEIGSEVTVVISKGPAAPQAVPVPAVRDTPLSDAEDELVAAGLVVGEVTEEPSDQVVAGNVIRSTPSAGQQVDPGTEVALVVSTGPDVVEPPVGAVPDVLVGGWNGGPGFENSEFDLFFSADGRYELYNDDVGLVQAGTAVVEGEQMTWVSDAGETTVMTWSVEPSGVGDMLSIDDGASTYFRHE